MKYMLTTIGGQFHAHHFPSDTLPKIILIYLGRVDMLGSREGTWLVYKRNPIQDPTEPEQMYEYDSPLMHHRPEFPKNDRDYVRFH